MSTRGERAIIELKIWLALFEERKRQLIAAGMTPDDADEAAVIEVRRQIRLTGFRQ